MGVQDNVRTGRTSSIHATTMKIAEWNFFATSHGKGPPDGVGGFIKREAAKASL